MADISVYITSGLTSSERRISPQWELDYLKERLELITGVAAADQQLQYYPLDDSSEYVVLTPEVSTGGTTVEAFNIRPYSRIHVADTNPDSEAAKLEAANGDTAESYDMTEEEYAQRGDTVLQWKKQNQLGRFDPAADAEKARKLAEDAEKVATFTVGDRCRVINIEGERRGTVKFLGVITMLDPEAPWVGIEFDEPVGKNDGSINGQRFFEARAKHGSFVKPKQVEVGDFPELDPFADSDEEL